MSRKTSLPALLKHLYAENSRFDVGPPVQILKELENNILVLADIEISDDDVPVLGRFFAHPQTCKLIKRIQVDRSSSRKAHVRRPDSAFTANGCRLLKELFKFIGNAKSLQCVCFESLEIPMDALPLLGRALVASTSAIAWLGFKDCDIKGDAGLRILTHYIGQLKLQVLAIEQCGLTDTSLVYIASILKAQQNNLDSLYWNATLRVDPTKRGNLWNASEIDSVYRCGLVALSLFGNQFEGQDMYVLTRVLRNNHWLLGLNLANNNIGRENMLILSEELLNNTVMQALLLKNNPGYDRHIASVMHAAITRNAADVSAEETQDIVEHLQIRHSSGSRRLEMQSPRIALLLRTWQQLQTAEMITPQVPVLPSKHPGGSTTSAATQATRPTTTVNGKRTAAVAVPSVKEKAPTPGTRRAAEAELVAQLSRPYGYSALDLVTDTTQSAPFSPRRRAVSPTFRVGGDRSFVSLLSTSLVSNGGTGNEPVERSPRAAYLAKSMQMHRSFEVPVAAPAPWQANGRRPEAVAAVAEEKHHHRSGRRADSIGDSIQLSEESLDVEGSQAAEGQDSQHVTPRTDQDVLDYAIPVASPPKASASSGRDDIVGSKGASAYYIAMDANGGEEAAPARETEGEARRGTTAAEDWGDVEWPLSEEVAHLQQEVGPEGRPPSRISIRHRSSSSPTPHDILRSLDEDYHRLLKRIGDGAEPPRRASPQRARPSTAPLRSSRDRATSKPFPPTRPFYAGGSIGGPSPPRPRPSTISNADMDVLFGPGRGIGRPGTSYVTDGRSRSVTPTTKRRIGKKGTRRTKSAKRASRSASLGKAHGPSGTRIRARSTERAEERHAIDMSGHTPGMDGRRASPGSATRRTGQEGAEAAAFANELSSTVLNATKNLETVSAKLRDVIDTLSTSMDMNFSMQRELMSATMLNITGQGMNTSRATWASPASAAVGATPLSAHRSAERPQHPSTSTPLSSSGRGGSAAQRYREHSASPTPFSAREEPQPAGHYGAGSGIAEDAAASRALAELVRSRMEVKLRTMFDIWDENA